MLYLFKDVVCRVRVAPEESPLPSSNWNILQEKCLLILENSYIYLSVNVQQQQQQQKLEPDSARSFLSSFYYHKFKDLFIHGMCTNNYSFKRINDIPLHEHRK